MACVPDSLSVPEAYHGNRNGESEQNMHKSEPSPLALGQNEGILRDKAARTPAQQKISSRLLYAVRLYGGELKSMEDLKRRSSVKVDADGTTLVDIKAQVTEAVLARIEAVGGKIISSFPEYQAIRARIPLDQIEPLAEMAQVIFIRPADEPMTN
jgi:hypothetical protein